MLIFFWHLTLQFNFCDSRLHITPSANIQWAFCQLLWKCPWDAKVTDSNQKINRQINSVFHRNVWNGPNIITSSHITFSFKILYSWPLNNKCVCLLICEFFSINMYCYSTSSVVGWICQYGTMDTGTWILLTPCVLKGSTVHHNSEFTNHSVHLEIHS